LREPSREGWVLSTWWRRAGKTTPEAFLAFLAENAEAERLMCVGHLPSIAAIASFFLSPGDPVSLVFGPGTVCRIRVAAMRRGGGDLLLFV
jgi:phosphohistidine phosphatase SixA